MNISDQEQNIFTQDSIRQKTDTAVHSIKAVRDSIVAADSVPLKKHIVLSVKEIPVPVDTTAICKRNSIADVTFYDSANIVSRISQSELNGFPYIFIEKNRIREKKVLDNLNSHLKNGEDLPLKPFNEDWIILIILAAAFIYSSIRTFSKSFMPEVIRFFSFRGIGEPASGDTSILFHWQSTIVNLISFFNIALFAYCAAFYYDFIPDGIHGIIVWFIAFGIIAAMITIRHLVCIVTGRLSGETEAFNEYLITIYQSYRYAALIVFILVILLSYTRIFTVNAIFITGLILLSVLYLMRITRLLLIFIKRNISLLYLILYLCALEFLPVLISVKYFTGLF